MSKWILIEVENQNINEPDTYDSYIEAYDEMKSRYENLVEEGDEASIDEYDANIQTDSYNIDWKIYEVESIYKPLWYSNGKWKILCSNWFTL